MCELHRDEQLRPASGTSKEDVRGGWRLRFEGVEGAIGAVLSSACQQAYWQRKKSQYRQQMR